MNKLKNIGISALAGTLVTLSAAQAGGVSVSGSYELSYTQFCNLLTYHSRGVIWRLAMDGSTLMSKSAPVLATGEW